MRVQRAIAFIDLCGFTAFTERHREEQVVRILAELRAGLREAAARRGVRVAKWLGDGAMVTSTDAASLVALLVEIDHRMTGTIRSLPVRAGIDMGPVIMFEGDDYIGRCVNLASRLCDQAQPHQILATNAAAIELPPWVTSEPVGPSVVRGMDQPIALHRLTLASGGDAVDPVCGLPLSPAHGVSADLGPGQALCSPACLDAWTQPDPIATSQP